MSNLDNNFAETIIDTQKKVVDSVTENAKKLANGNNMLNETIEKSSEWYKNWLETQKTFFKKTAETTASATESVKDNAGKLNEFYENWMTMQNNWTKQMSELNQEWMKNIKTNQQVNNNPFADWQSQWNNWMSQFQNNNWMNQFQNNNWMNQFQNNNWMNQMQQHNPFSADAMKKTNDTWTNFFNQYQEVMNGTFSNWQKNLQNGNIQDAFKNMTHTTDAFNKFAELWMPMFKSVQDKSFNMDVYKQWMNPDTYKELMDKYFGFLPENNRNYFQQMTQMWQNNAKQMGTSAMQNFQQMKQNFGNAAFQPADMFSNMLSGHNYFTNMMNEAVAPFTKMMTQTDQTRTMQEWAEIANRITVYNIKNSELQFMIYSQGSKIMDKLAENVASKMQDGKEVTSMLALYQEWLNISDKVYVTLFESDEYSKMMAEVSAMQMTLKKDIERQMEKFMTGVPVATRSEMDEVYKTVYDLKTQIRNLEKKLVTAEESVKEELAEEIKDETAAEKTARRTKKA